MDGGWSKNCVTSFVDDPLPDVFDECDVLIVDASSHNDQLKKQETIMQVSCTVW